MSILNKFLRKKEEEKSFLSYKAIAVMIIFFCVIMLLNSKSVKINNEDNGTEEQETGDFYYSVLETEKKLEEILSKIKGAGDVDVMIYYSNLGEKIIASDSRTRNEKENRGEGVESVAEDKEKNTVLYGGSGNEMPFITEERLPEASGILVIAEGAHNEKVKYEIREAVRALLGVSPNRIRVAEKNKIGQ